MSGSAFTKLNFFAPLSLSSFSISFNVVAIFIACSESSSITGFNKSKIFCISSGLLKTEPAIFETLGSTSSTNSLVMLYFFASFCRSSSNAKLVLTTSAILVLS